SDGAIREVGPTRRLENVSAAREAEEINAAGRVVMPGFVDSFTQIIGPPIGRAGHDVAIEASEPDFTAQSKVIQEASSKSLGSMALRLLKQFASHGTTTVETESGFGLGANAELRLLRVQRSLHDQFISVLSTFAARRLPPEFEGHPDQFASAVA